MAEFIDIASISRVLFAPNTLPITQLLLKGNQSRLGELFSFQNLQVEADINAFQLIASTGELEGIPVVQLSIDPIAINLHVLGARAELDRVSDALRQILIEIDPRRRLEHPHIYTTTHQTQSTVRLSAPFENLLSPALVAFLREHKKAFEPEHSSAELSLGNLAFNLRYTTQTADFVYFPKQIRIEPRSGSNPEERLYYVQTPTDSDTQRQLLEELERALTDQVTTA